MVSCGTVRLSPFVIGAAFLCTCCGRTTLHGSPDASGGARGGNDGGNTGGGSDGSGGNAPLVHIDTPGPLLSYEECVVGRGNVAAWDELPRCDALYLYELGPCIDDSKRLVLPAGIDVSEMGAVWSYDGDGHEHLFFRVDGDPDALGMLRSRGDLHFFTDAPSGRSLLVTTQLGALRLNDGCTPTCGEWLAYETLESEGSNASSLQQEPAAWNELAAGEFSDGDALWLRRPLDGNTTILSYTPSSSGDFQASVTIDDATGIAVGWSSAYVSTAGGELIHLSYPDLAEMGRIEAQTTSLGTQGPLIQSDGGAFVLLTTENGGVELGRVSEYDFKLEPESPRADVSDALMFADELGELFLATATTVEKYEGASRRVIASATEPGSIAAIAYDEPYLFVAARGTVSSNGEEVVAIDALSLSGELGCIDGIR